jgi:hypothetical protein
MTHGHSSIVRNAAVLAGLLLTACSPFAPSDRASATTPTPYASSDPRPIVEPARAHCDAPVPSNRALALVSLESQDIVLADIGNPAVPKRLCSITGASMPRLIGATRVGYVAYASGQFGGPGALFSLDLDSGKSTSVDLWVASGYAAGTFAWDPAGKAVAYLVSTPVNYAGVLGEVRLHLWSEGRDRIAATLPGVGGRGVSPDDDDMMLGYSPDGQYLALVNTFTAGGSGAQAPFQVRRSDGSLVDAFPSGQAAAPGHLVFTAGSAYPSGSRTMATWAGTGSRLYYRAPDGVHRWDAPSTTTLVLPGLKWIRPRPSPDGRWIAYMVRDSTSPAFLSRTTLWYAEERLCGPGDQSGCGGMGPPTVLTGKTYLYDFSARKETLSTISRVYDVWPGKST